MKPLALSGRAAQVIARDASLPPDTVLRLIDPQSSLHLGGRDAFLVRSKADADRAAELCADNVVVVGSEDIASDRFALFVRLGSEFEYLSGGDILGINANLRIRTLYRRSSRHNSFLVTERCNHYCLMCSQPPKEADDSSILARLKSAIGLVDKNTKSIGFTGGEPLLNWKPFVELLHFAKEELPNTAIHVLTNGRGFANPNVSHAWAALQHPDLMAGIPIYSCVDRTHDYVVQAPGAFDETILGILRLKDAGGRIEIRVVLHQITAPIIAETAKWIAREKSSVCKSCRVDGP